MKRPVVPYDGDVLRDIGTGFSGFWRRCEDLLPEDWAMQLTVRQHEGFPVYIVQAFLVDESLEEVPIIRAGGSTAERALERLYYTLRDGLLDQAAILKSLDLRQP